MVNMSENVPRAESSLMAQQQGSEYVIPEELLQRRADFVQLLQTDGLISNDLATSGELDSFELDIKTGGDALIHTLIGNENGGAHHMRTILDLEIPNRVVASEVNSPSDRPISELRREQSVRPNGAFRARIIGIDSKAKEGGSAMFPTEWSTEDVIRAILTVSRTAPTNHDGERGLYLHVSEINGVRVSVTTNEKTGKIITAFPKVSTK